MATQIDHKSVWALVRRQHEVVTRAQLHAFGLSTSAIRHRLSRGRLFVEYPGVYRVGRRPLGREGRFMAAVLACGPGAMLSHESAANLWGIRKGGLDPVDVSVPAGRRIRRVGIRVHRRDPMPDATTKQVIPLSRPLFTLVDLAAELEQDALEAALNEADRLGLVDFEFLERDLDAIAPFRGIAALRATIARYTRTDSNLERRFLAILRKHRLPMPATQQHIGPGRIDFYWPDLALVVETDGLTYHRTPIQQLADRRRDQAHLAAGRTQIRFPDVQIRETPADVADVLARVMKRLVAAADAA